MALKILQVNNFHYLRGGSERYFFDVTRLLREKGHNVLTFSTANPRNENTSWLAGIMPNGIETDRLRSLKQICKYVYSVEARSAIDKVINSFKPDIVHLHIYYGQLTPSILGPIKQSGAPIVQTLHDYKLVCPTHGLRANGRYCDICCGKHYWRAVVQRCNRNSIGRSLLSMIEAYSSDLLGAKSVITRYIAVSDYQKKHLVRLGINQNKISVLHNFTEYAENPASRPGSYILYVGRVSEDKGIKCLLDAYSRIPEHSPKLKVVGSGAMMSKWYEYARDLKLGNRIEWLGHVTGDKLTKIYRECLFVVNPTLLNETFGLTCIEALAQAKPVIASRAGAIPEIVRDKVDGILISPGSVDELAHALLKMLSNQTDIVAMGLRGWDNVRRFYSPDRHYNCLMNIYEGLLN